MIKRYRHTETGEIKNHRDWQNELGCSFHSGRTPEFLETYAPTPVEMTIEQRREQQRHLLKSDRECHIESPVNGVQVRDKDRDRLSRAIQRGAMPDKWILADNTERHVSLQEASNILARYDQREFEAFTVYRELLLQLEASDNPESIVWPEEI